MVDFVVIAVVVIAVDTKYYQVWKILMLCY